MRYAEALAEALDGQVATVALVGPGLLALESPNPGWSVSDVIRHTVGVTVKFTAFAAGRTDAPRTPVGDLLGADHVDAVRRAAVESHAAWRAVDPDRRCRLPFGTFDADVAAGINLFDVLVHSWELEVVTGVPFDCSDRSWRLGLEAARVVVGPHRDPQHYGPEIPVDPTTTPPREALLAFLGRRA